MQNCLSLLSVFHAVVTPCYTPCWIPEMSNTQSDTENTHSPPCVRSVQASTCICMNTDRQMHTHGNTGKATFIQTQRRRWVTAPKLALRCTSLFLLPPPPPSPFSLLGWGAPWRHLSLSKGVKALRWEPSQLVWRRLGSQLAAGRPPPAAHGCHSDEKTFGGTYFQNTIMEILLLFFLACLLKGCPAAGASEMCLFHSFLRSLLLSF